MNIEKTYIYANSQIIAQHDGDHNADRYFYLHDRLGSVRLVIDTSADVKNFYTYNPFGELFPTDSAENVSNPFKFTGQYLDSETGYYYLRARQYDPYIGRFTSRDSVFGEFGEPLSLHKYLYCQNEPINRTDPLGLLYTPKGGPHYGYEATEKIIQRGEELVDKYGQLGMYMAFGPLGDLFNDWRRHPGPGKFDYKETTCYSFSVWGAEGSYGHGRLRSSEFGNYFAGYLGYRVGSLGITRAVGDIYQTAYKLEQKWKGTDSFDIPWKDDPASKYWISKGALDSNTKMQIRAERAIREANENGGFFKDIRIWEMGIGLKSLREDARRLRRDVTLYDQLRQNEM